VSPSPVAAAAARLKKLPGKRKPPTLAAFRREIAAAGDPVRAAGVARFFKTGKGDYGEGDKFLGITVPRMRALARTGRGLSLEHTLKLLRSPWHEERAVALVLLVEAHDRGSSAERRAIHRAYLANTKYVNNWDLVDMSAPELVGRHIADGGTRLIERLAKSTLLWERRIAMVATHRTTRDGDTGPAVLIAERLLGDEHDLMHKAVGWMLREVGKKSPDTLRAFLKKHAAVMPRTALRYSIERFTPDERKRWMSVPRASSSRAPVG
jgi:3-methyladenine DNA glycosylase AlkD